MDAKPAVSTEPAVAATAATTPSPPSSDSSVLEYESLNAPSRRRWTVGTLTYTTAGLVLVMVWLLVGSAGAAARDRSYNNGFNLLLKQFKASNFAIALLMTTMPQVISVLVAPMVSFRSDRHRSRWGRRIPFAFLVAVAGTVGMTGIAFSPRIAPQLHMLLGANSPGLTPCALIVFGIFWTIFQLGVVCTMPIMNGLAYDVVPRPVLGRYYGANRAVGLAVGMVFNWWILGQVKAHFQLIFVAIALVYGMTLGIMCLMVREGDYPPPPADEDDFRAGGFVASVKTYFRECYSKPHYLWIFAAFALGGITLMPVNAFNIFYAEKLGVDTGLYGKTLATNHFCGFLVAFPLGVLVDRFHTLRMSIITMALYGITLLAAGFFIQGPRTLLLAVFLQAFTSGFYLTTSMSLSQALLPRLKYGQFFSASLLLTAVVTILFSLALGYALDTSGSNYRLTYFAGFALAMLTVAVLAVVHRRYMAMGGPTGYVAPS